MNLDFDLTPEQVQTRETVKRFAQKEIAPHVLEYNREGCLPLDIVAKMKEMGLIGGVIPPEYGGAGIDHVSWVISIEEISRVCSSLAVVVGGPSSLIGQGILRFGTEQQKQKYLATMARGESMGAAGITEPNTGTDVANIQTTAVRKGDEYILNGSKMFITNGGICDWAIVFATMDKSLRHKGITAFIIERGMPGFSSRSIAGKLAWQPLDLGELIFEDCRVPRENLVGEEMRGFKIVMSCLDMGRLFVAARALGLAQGCLDASLNYSKERTVFGQPIASYQLIQKMIADMAVGVEMGRLLLYQVARLRDKGAQRTTKYSSMAKLFNTELAMKAATDAVQIHGAYGFTSEYHVERYFREAKGLQIVEGTTQIHTILQAAYALGLRSDD
ncbi:MAG: butyryl-CoA dehydrogenase [Candidatus Abyssobacteria bacterium SURF_17]|uniref:Cyclohex-1-ene-1-carbonyl-CoA dehydrogenase n=1 Tax=Candidatus Abyssobacteria bacterium SURF_17 TaxID=2093361 RepID=A0A419F0F4_9BACT|nr:MAG: butyryl-CoA dehydrogenase [Candidatus Abyssubacteria bacterium SURF_17]